MANRSVSLDTKVFSISDLKREGSGKLPPMYRGMSHLPAVKSKNSQGQDFYNEGTMDMDT